MLLSCLHVPYTSYHVTLRYGKLCCLMFIAPIFFKEIPYICITIEGTRCTENNGGCQDQCEEGNITREAICSCSIPGTRLSADKKTCVGKKCIEHMQML